MGLITVSVLSTIACTLNFFKKNPRVALSVAGAFSGPLFCFYIYWVIMGLIWRFGSAGSFAAGHIRPEGVTPEQHEESINAEGSLF